MIGKTNAVGASSPYTVNMINFFAIPGASSKIRLRIEKPLSAAGAMIRYKTTPWTAGDTKDTGTLVANVTDDSSYKDANEWYEVSGLSDGTAYYFKAFPYFGSNYNQELSVNETTCKAGGLASEYTFDSVSGSTVTDTAGSYNMTTASGSSISGKVGNAMQFVGSSAYGTIPKAACPSGAKSIVLSVKNEGNSELIIWDGKDGGTYNANVAVQLTDASGKLFVGAHSGSVYTFLLSNLGPIPNDGEFHTVVITFTGSTEANGVKVYLDNVLIGQGTSTTPTSITASYNIGVNRTGSGYAPSKTLKIDQLRFFNRVLESYERDNIHNGGAGC